MLVVINLKISNLSSVLNALDFLAIKYKVSDKAEDIKGASGLILPGVGTFEAGMGSLEKSGLLEVLKQEVVKNKKPILGICLGMQMFFEDSEESPGAKGLSFFKGSVRKLPKNKDYTIPRIGWGESYVKKEMLGLNVGQTKDFYYIHSFAANPLDNGIIAITTEKTGVCGAVCEGNIFGCQFHPEKSHTAGLNILKEFANKYSS